MQKPTFDFRKMLVWVLLYFFSVTELGKVTGRHSNKLAVF